MEDVHIFSFASGGSRDVIRKARSNAPRSHGHAVALPTLVWCSRSPISSATATRRSSFDDFPEHRVVMHGGSCLLRGPVARRTEPVDAGLGYRVRPVGVPEIRTVAPGKRKARAQRARAF